MKLLGTPTIHPVVFVLGKVSVAPPFLFLAKAALDARTGTLAFPGLAPFAALAVVAGAIVAGVSIHQLGASIRVGLPEEQTAFKTRGLYRFSRNPIYAGLFLSMAGSCVLVPHWLNLASTALAIAVHHLIVLGEERFLEGRFGDDWREYRARVRRYC